MPKLTKRVVDGAELRPTPYFIWDAELPGFGVRVFPSGKRVYYADYRTDSGRRRMTIGPHGKITTDEARKLAISTMGSVVKGEDPLVERKTRRRSLTVAQLCDRYLEAAEHGLILGKRGGAKKASTLEIDRGRISRHIKPLLGSRLVIDLGRPDINRFMRDVATGKTARKDRSGKNGARVEVTGGTGTASRTVGLLGGILTFAVSEGIIDANPVQGVKKPADKSRDRRLSPDEYRAIGKALVAAVETEAWQSVAGAWLISLSGCRLGEIEKLKRSEVDEPGGGFRLEDSKEGASVRPMGRNVFEALRKLPVDESSPYVLPAARQDAGHFHALPAAWARLTKAAGVTGVTPHTMRHSFASVAGDLGFADSTISALLGHSVGTVTSRYVHRLDSVLVAAADKVASEIFRQMTGATADVLPFPQRAMK
jgi:integrase